MATIYCMNCGTELDEGARFCGVCGSPTLLGAGLADAQGRAQVACPNCGALNDSNDRFCTECGAALDEASLVPVGPLSSAYARHDREVGVTSATRTRTVFMGAAVGGFVALALVVGLFASGILGHKDTEAPVDEGSQVLVEDPAAEPEEEAEVTGAGIEVRASLADYSWSELSIIGKEMSRQLSREDALAIAREYNLVDQSGHMAASTKDLTIDGLGTFRMRVVDVYHDDLANGEGKAGLTLISSNAPVTHHMNEADDISGGWEGCEMRSWLNGEVLGMLDEEVRTAIVPVDKRTDNVGNGTDPAAVTSTIDSLWLPSMVELMGTIDWTWPSDPANSSGYNAITNAEGSQYALYSEMNVVGLEGNSDLVARDGSDAPTVWWERTCSPSGVMYFRGVSDIGDPTDLWTAHQEHGVCLGFCL